MLDSPAGFCCWSLQRPKFDRWTNADDSALLAFTLLPLTLEIDVFCAKIMRAVLHFWNLVFASLFTGLRCSSIVLIMIWVWERDHLHIWSTILVYLVCWQFVLGFLYCEAFTSLHIWSTIFFYLVCWKFVLGFLYVRCLRHSWFMLSTFLLFVRGGGLKVCLYVMFDALPFSGIFLKLVRHFVFLVWYCVFLEVIFCDGFAMIPGRGLVWSEWRWCRRRSERLMMSEPGTWWFLLL